MTGFWRTVVTIVRKDLVVEARTKELVLTAVFFGIACVLVFSFSFVVEGVPLTDAAAGILWIAIAFSGTLALARTFERERQADTIRALMAAPVERAAIYVGKLVSLLVLMTVVQILIVPTVGLLFQVPLDRSPLVLIALLVTGMVGFGAVGTLFAAMLMRAHARDVLLPVLLYPMTVPVVIAGVRGTAALFAEEPSIDVAEMWLSMLVFFDAVFVTLALWVFDAVMGE